MTCALLKVALEKATFDPEFRPGPPGAVRVWGRCVVLELPIHGPPTCSPCRSASASASASGPLDKDVVSAVSTVCVWNQRSVARDSLS